MLCSARMLTPAWVIIYSGSAADTAMLYSLLEAEEIPVRIGDEAMGTLAPHIIEGGGRRRSRCWCPTTGWTMPRKS